LSCTCLAAHHEPESVEIVNPTFHVTGLVCLLVNIGARNLRKGCSVPISLLLPSSLTLMQGIILLSITLAVTRKQGMLHLCNPSITISQADLLTSGARQHQKSRTLCSFSAALCGVPEGEAWSEPSGD